MPAKSEVALTLAAALLAVPAVAQTNTPIGKEPTVEQRTPDVSNPKSAADFVRNAMSGNELEIETSRLAVERGSSAKVKDFARRMVDDHTAAGRELGEIVSSAQVGVDATGSASALNPKHRDMLNRLTAATPERFDATYADIQIAAHRGAVSLFSSYARNGTVADLTGFAEKMLPNLEDHLAGAEDLMR